MMVFKRKQVVILLLILMIVVAGYLQYSYKQGSSSASTETGKLGEAVYVDNLLDGDSLADEGQTAVADTNIKSDESASKVANDYFAQAKMDKDTSRSKSNEELKAITEDKNASKEAKDEAYEQMVKLVDNSETEMRIETLVKKMGFSDAVALIGDDGSIDVIVKAPSLTDAQTAQIADLVSRQAKVEIGNIHIKKLY